MVWKQYLPDTFPTLQKCPPAFRQGPDICVLNIKDKNISTVWQTQTADWQLHKVNIVVKCSNGFPIPKTSLLENLKVRVRESVKSSHNNKNLIYLPVCKFAVCVCRTPEY